MNVTFILVLNISPPTKTKALQCHTVNLNELRHVPPTKESQIEA